MLLGCVTLSLGFCAPRPIPDPRIPHRLAGDVEATIWCRMPDGTLAPADIRLPEGWWVAAPQVVEPQPSNKESAP